jgi:hypothetical protein
MIPKKPAPDLIRGGNRFLDKIMRQLKIMIPKNGNRFPACAKPIVMGRCFAHASAGEGRSDKIMCQQKIKGAW